MNEFSSFIDIIREFIQLFDSLISIEQSKLDAAVKNRVSFVEDCMNKEQAAILRLRGLEQKRERAQAQLGMKDLTFREILDKAPEDAVAVLRPMFDQLSSQIQTFQAVSSNARDIIEVNLHMIQSSLASGTADRAVHSQTGTKKDDKRTHFTSRSV